MTNSLMDDLGSYCDIKSNLKWSGTLRDYIGLLKENPGLHMGAHERVLKMIDSHGVVRDDDGEIESYNFFSNEMFGLDQPIKELMSYLRAASRGSEVGRRILLMYGPTSSGKSQISVLLKRGLEAFSETQEGAIYKLSDSPMFEDPLTAIPIMLRSKVEAELGLKIKGDLSPLTQLILDDKYNGNFLNLPVERYFISERNRSSIGTFLPANPKDQDLSELVGSMDLSRIGEYGSESDPRAYKFDGELMVSNRGIMEFVEMLKVDQKFLYVLLTLAQEKNIKTGRFPLIYADEFVLSHTNESEYNRFLAKDEMEALHDRTIVIKVPYNTSIDNEVRIYEKLVAQANFDDVHIAPHTLKCAAMFGVLSRLKESNHRGMTLLGKMKLYNGEEAEGFSLKELSKFKEEFPTEGMTGISPRYVINRIATVLAEEGGSFITPIDVIRSLRDGLVSNPKITRKNVEELESVFTTVISEYSQIAKNDVQKAFFVNFEEEVQSLLKNYMDHVEGFLDGTQLEDEWGNPSKPDERLMRSVEEKIGVTASGARSFRQEVSRKMLRTSSNGEYNYKSHPKLRDALEKQLFDERQDVIRLTVSARNPDEKELKKINVVIDTLVEKHGYSTGSANQLLRYVSSLMARG